MVIEQSRIEPLPFVSSSSVALNSPLDLEDIDEASLIQSIGSGKHAQNSAQTLKYFLIKLNFLSIFRARQRKPQLPDAKNAEQMLHTFSGELRKDTRVVQQA